MNLEIHIAENTLDLKLEGEMTIYTATEMRQQFMGVLARACLGMDIRMDMQNVTEIDSAGVQLLVLLKRELNSLGLFVKVTRWSQVVEETFHFVGIPEFLTEAPAWIE